MKRSSVHLISMSVSVLLLPCQAAATLWLPSPTTWQMWFHHVWVWEQSRSYRFGSKGMCLKCCVVVCCTPIICMLLDRVPPQCMHLQGMLGHLHFLHPQRHHNLLIASSYGTLLLLQHDSCILLHLSCQTAVLTAAGWILPKPCFAHPKGAAAQCVCDATAAMSRS